MKTIVTLTINPAVDMFLEVSRLVPQRKLRCEPPLFAAGGGGGINVSRAIGRLGGASTAVFPAGGSSGDRLVMMLQREGVPVNVIRVAEPVDVCHTSIGPLHYAGLFGRQFGSGGRRARGEEPCRRSSCEVNGVILLTLSREVTTGG